MILKSTKNKGHLLNNYRLKYAYCELFTEGFEMDVFHIYIYIYIYNIHIYFKVCGCIYKLCSDITQGKYEYRTISHLITRLIYFRMYRCIYRILSNLIWENMNIGQYYS